jgi:ribosomal protein S12 methylthiotransferase
VINAGLLVHQANDLSYYIISLGCSKNQVDSELLNGSMLSAGYRQSASAEEADIIIVNTCGFITPAKQESIDTLLEASELKPHTVQKLYKPNKTNSSEKNAGIFTRKIAAFGCLISRYSDDLRRDMPEVDFFYGLMDDLFVPSMSEAFGINITVNNEKRNRSPLVDGLSYTYVKIADGCSNNCSFCAIPLIRGSHRANDPDIIISELESAVASGCKEAIVVAQDISLYKWNGIGLYDLIGKMNKIEDLSWIRLMYCHPDHIDEKIFSIFTDHGKVVRYIDIPFQHVSKRILKSMGRNGDAAAYFDLISRLRTIVPGIRIRSTFMVGYPGETNAEFDELLDFLKSSCIDRAGSFIWSPEEGTRAFDLKDRVSSKKSSERQRRLMTLQEKISANRLSELIGTEIDVLIEEKIDDKTWLCRSEFDAPEVDGFFYLTAENQRINSLVKARITASLEHDLIGVIT